MVPVTGTSKDLSPPTIGRGRHRRKRDLGQQMRSGTTWSVANAVILKLGTFAVGIVAARLIAPDQFGVFAVALTVHAIVLNISDLGVNAFLVRHQGDVTRIAPTVLTVALVSSGLLAVAMGLSAPVLATLLGAPEATVSVQILALTVVVAGFTSVPTAILVREFRQDKRFVAEAVSFVLSNALLVVLAVMGGGALALAWSRLAGHVVTAILMIVLAAAYFRPALDRDQLRQLLRFGLPLVGSSFLGFLIANIDYIVIARIEGVEPLGLYTLAYNIASWPYSVLTAVVAGVFMAAFARIRDDRARLPAYTGTSLSALCAVAMPVGALIAVLSEPIVVGVYGERWRGAAVALSVTAVYGTLRVPADLFSSIAISFGRTRAMFRCQLAYLIAIVPLTIIGVDLLGISGAGWAHVLGIALVLLPGFYLLLRPVTDIDIRLLVRSAGPPLVGAVLAGAAASTAAGWVGGTWAAIGAGLLAGAVVYLVVLGPWLLRTLRQTRSLWGQVEDDPASRSPSTLLAEDTT